MNPTPEAVRIRRMTPADMDRVTEIAASHKDAPQWPRSAYLAALDPAAAPLRIALVAEEVAGQVELLAEEPEKLTSRALQAAEKLNSEGGGGFNPRIKPTEPTRASALEECFPPISPETPSFSASCNARFDFAAVAERLGSRPDTGKSSSAACATVESGRVLGFLVASLLPPQAELETIAVAPHLQRHGLARRLFAALTGELAAAQVTEVMLEVRASNQPALGFYRQMGFVEAGRRRRYYHDPAEDAVLMHLRL